MVTKLDKSRVELIIYPPKTEVVYIRYLSTSFLFKNHLISNGTSPETEGEYIYLRQQVNVCGEIQWRI